MNQGSVGKNKPVIFSFWSVELKFCCSVSHIILVKLKVILIIQENCNGRQPRISNDFLKAMIWNSRNAVFLGQINWYLQSFRKHRNFCFRKTWTLTAWQSHIGFECLIKVSQRSVYINNCGNVSALVFLKNGRKHSAEWLWYCTIKSFPRFTPYLIRGQLSLLDIRHQVIPQRIDICFPMDWPTVDL